MNLAHSFFWRKQTEMFYFHLYSSKPASIKMTHKVPYKKVLSKEMTPKTESNNEKAADVDYEDSDGLRRVCEGSSVLKFNLDLADMIIFHVFDSKEAFKYKMCLYELLPPNSKGEKLLRLVSHSPDFVWTRLGVFLKYFHSFSLFQVSINSNQQTKAGPICRWLSPFNPNFPEQSPSTSN